MSPSRPECQNYAWESASSYFPWGQMSPVYLDPRTQYIGYRFVAILREETPLGKQGKPLLILFSLFANYMETFPIFTTPFSRLVSPSGGCSGFFPPFMCLRASLYPVVPTSFLRPQHTAAVARNELRYHPSKRVFLTRLYISLGNQQLTISYTILLGGI